MSSLLAYPSSALVSSNMSQLILSSCNLLQFSIPNSARSFQGTTKKLHWNLTTFWVIVILHMPICGMHELL